MTELQRSMQHAMERSDLRPIKENGRPDLQQRQEAVNFRPKDLLGGPRTPQALPDWPIKRNLWVAIWIVVVIAAAQVSLFINPLVGLYVNAGTLASLIYLAILHERARPLVIPVAIIPTALMVGLSLPGVTGLQASLTVSVVILLLGLVYQYLYTLDYPKEGFARAKQRLRSTQLLTIPLMVVLGQVIGLIGFGFLHNQYEFRASPLILVFLAAAVFAISEEILFRGLIQQRAMLLMHPLVAALLSAVLYTLLTIGHHGGMAFPVVGALIGAATSWIYYRRQNLLLTIAVNMSTKLTYFGLVAVFVLR